MPDIPASVIVTAVTTLVAGAMGAILTNVLNARLSTEEKIWELRRASYGLILAGITEFELYLEEQVQYVKEAGQGAVHFPNISLSSRRHLASIKKSFTDNYLILSERFIYLFEDFLHSLDYGEPNPSEEYKIFLTAVRLARQKLSQQARSEMPLWGRLREGERRRWMFWRRRGADG